MSVDQFDAIDRMFCDITRNNIPFGGKVFVFGGDFSQLLHVIPGGSPAMIIEKCVTSSPVWHQHIQVFHLTKIMRLRDENDNLFNDYLLKLGSGHPDLIKSEEPLKGLTFLPPSCITDQNLESEIFPSDFYDKSVFSSLAIVCPTNEINGF